GRRSGGGRVPGRAVRVRRGGRGARAARTHGAAHLHRRRRRPVGPAGPLRPLVTAGGAERRRPARREFWAGTPGGPSETAEARIPERSARRRRRRSPGPPGGRRALPARTGVLRTRRT